LEHYNVSRESLERLEIYVDTLLSWQRRINLIGPSTVDVVWTRHILDASSFCRFCQLELVALRNLVPAPEFRVW
jgi:16S rRNA (guanine527-N7)-methyltransferase